jgi:hypothetical protein
MPTPSTPIVPGQNLTVTKIAERQKEYETLPAWISDDGVVLTRWHLSWKERFIAFFRGDIYLFQWTFNRPLQPVAMQIKKPNAGS